MKAMTKGLCVLAACVACWNPRPAEAINKEWSAALGFLGGLLFADAVSCDSVRHERVYEQPVVVEKPVVIERSCGRRRPSRGWWEYREKRVWVPGHWRYEGRHGRCRIWEDGHYRTVRVRVWVTPDEDWDDCD